MHQTFNSRSDDEQALPHMQGAVVAVAVHGVLSLDTQAEVHTLLRDSATARKYSPGEQSVECVRHGTESHGQVQAVDVNRVCVMLWLGHRNLPVISQPVLMLIAVVRIVVMVRLVKIVSDRFLVDMHMRSPSMSRQSASGMQMRHGCYL